MPKDSRLCQRLARTCRLLASYIRNRRRGTRSQGDAGPTSPRSLQVAIIRSAHRPGPAGAGGPHGPLLDWQVPRPVPVRLRKTNFAGLSDTFRRSRRESVSTDRRSGGHLDQARQGRRRGLGEVVRLTILRSFASTFHKLPAVPNWETALFDR